MQSPLLFVVLGLLAGILSGIIGIGGGVIIVPALVFLFGFTQRRAQGTTLAMLVPPIGILAAWMYYRHGCVDLKVAALVAAGFFIGSLLGARYATTLSNAVLSKVFGIAIILIGIKMVVGK
jgi:uncharacterized protein